jgi:CRISPR-associated protein Csm3
MKLKDIKTISGRIILKSGLHIGAGDAEMRIGGTDNPVIKHPHTLEPYIPGSSLKGKTRALLELRSGLMHLTKGEPLSLKNLQKLEGPDREQCEKILMLFGCSGSDIDETNSIGPTRVSFADCPLNKDWKEKALKQNLPLTEVKSENSINRIEGTARNPRFTERVPADAEFDFSITLKKLASDDDLEGFLLEGLKLLQLDALGGNGSRGYGRLEFAFNDPAVAEKFAAIVPL